MRTIPAVQRVTFVKGSTVVTASEILAGVNIRGGVNTDTQLPSYSAAEFDTHVDVYYLGILLRNGNDVTAGNNPSTGDLKFTFIVRASETITIMVRR